MKFASHSSLPASLPRSCAVRVLVAPSRSAPTKTLVRGKSFGRKRIEHAVEVAGACIMLAVFLMLALLA